MRPQSSPTPVLAPIAVPPTPVSNSNDLNRIKLLESRVSDLKSTALIHLEEKKTLNEKIKRLESDQLERVNQAEEFMSLFNRLSDWFNIIFIFHLFRLNFAQNFSNYMRDEKEVIVNSKESNSSVASRLSSLPKIKLDEFKACIDDFKNDWLMTNKSLKLKTLELEEVKLVFLLIYFVY